jgi:hypothetical protein
MARILRKLYASDIMFIDPLECESTVGYHVTKRGTKVSGNIDLSDCQRKISWYFGNDAIAKIDNAIKILTDFKKAYVAAKKGV